MKTKDNKERRQIRAKALQELSADDAVSTQPQQGEGGGTQRKQQAPRPQAPKPQAPKKPSGDGSGFLESKPGPTTISSNRGSFVKLGEEYPEDKPYTYSDFEARIREEVQNMGENYADPNEDTLHEIVDNAIPVYNAELLRMAIDNLGLGTTEPEVYGFDGTHSAVNAIAGVLYDDGMGWAYEEFGKLQEGEVGVPVEEGEGVAPEEEGA